MHAAAHARVTAKTTRRQSGDLASSTYRDGGVAPKLGIPIFVLQGERDYQVTLVDFEGWKRALKGKKTATFKLYPGQNHHFMPGNGPSTPQEYDQPNHVAKEVVDDIAAWVSK